MKLLSALRAQYEGVPIGWPEHEDAATQEMAVRAAVDRALASCPDLPLRLDHIDCDEYPCMAWFERNDGSDETLMFLGECPAWTGIYGTEMSSSQGVIEIPSGSRRYWAIAARPSNWPPEGTTMTQNWYKRFSYRIGENVESLTLDWGGTDPSTEP